VFAGLGLIDRESATLELGAIQGGNGGFTAIAHFDEAETARAARFAIADDLGPRHGPVSPERLDEVVRAGLEGEVADVQILAQNRSLCGHRARAKEQSDPGPDRDVARNSVRRKSWRSQQLRNGMSK